MLVEVRVTRPVKYGKHLLDSNFQIHSLQDREGDYISGDTIEDAIQKATNKYPNEPIDVQYWGQSPHRGLYRGTYISIDNSDAIVLPFLSYPDFNEKMLEYHQMKKNQ